MTAKYGKTLYVVVLRKRESLETNIYCTLKVGEKRMKIKNGFPAILFLAISVIATVLVCTVDVQAIGPMGTKVGFAGVNGEFHDTVGVHMVLYNLTEALGIGAIVIVFGFAVIGLLLKKHMLMK